MKKIDVIIPAYNSHKTIKKTLASLACQSVSDKLNVVIVNDSGENYSEIVELFSKLIDITELKTEKNSGPAVARQLGLDKTSSEYVLFVDSDDTINGAFSIAHLLRTIEEKPEANVVVGDFLEEGDNLTFAHHQLDLVWLFGKLYRRSFLQKNGIRFSETSQNEDAGFNIMVKLSVDDYAKEIIFTGQPVYYWHKTPGSITMDEKYYSDLGFKGYIDNMIFGLDNIRISEEKRKKVCVDIFSNIFLNYVEIKNRVGEIEGNFDYCKKFFKKFEEEIRKTPEDAIETHFEIVKDMHPRLKDLFLTNEFSIKGFIQELA